MNEQEYDAMYKYGAELGKILISMINTAYDMSPLKSLSANFGFMDAINEALESFLVESI